MSSDNAPRYESRHAFVERVINRLENERRIPPMVVARMVQPLLRDAIPYDPIKQRNIVDMLCVDEQDRASFRRHFLGGD